MLKTKTRLLSVFLALLLCFGAIPSAIFAADTAEILQTTLHYYSKVTKTYVTDSCWYTDDWFAADPADRNDALALLSAQLSAAATDTPSRVEDLLGALGFETAAYDYDGTAPDRTAFVVGKKALTDGKKLAAVVVQSDLYGERGWLQNVTVNADGMAEADDHAAFSAAAGFLLEKLGPEDYDVLWFAGLSRGGGIANLAAAYAIDAGCGRVFGYTFESPMTTADPDAQAAKYAGIHNYVSDDDPVTMLPLAAWGMTRYGTDILYNYGIASGKLTEQIALLNPDAADYFEYKIPRLDDEYEAAQKAALGRIIFEGHDQTEHRQVSEYRKP